MICPKFMGILLPWRWGTFSTSFMRWYDTPQRGNYNVHLILCELNKGTFCTQLLWCDLNYELGPFYSFFFFLGIAYPIYSYSYSFPPSTFPLVRSSTKLRNDVRLRLIATICIPNPKPYMYVNAIFCQDDIYYFKLRQNNVLNVGKILISNFKYIKYCLNLKISSNV